LGIGDRGMGIGPNPQSPIPYPQCPIPNPQLKLDQDTKLNKIILIELIYIFRLNS